MSDGKDLSLATSTAIYQQHEQAIPEIPCIKIDRESKPRETKESVFTMKFPPEPKRENKTYSHFKGKLNFEVIKK